ncbi:hypothetical protein MHYP_G00007080 [Metynnis hypsauchen]
MKVSITVNIQRKESHQRAGSPSQLCLNQELHSQSSVCSVVYWQCLHIYWCPSYWELNATEFEISSGFNKCKEGKEVLKSLLLYSSLQILEKPKPAVRVEPQSTVYTGDTVTLICELQTSLTGWTFYWLKTSQSEPLTADENTNTISVTVSNTGTAEYKCAARRGETNTHYSDPVKITVRERPKAEVKVQPAEQVFITERVTLTCDIEGGDVWSYEWFKNNKHLSEAERRKKYQISNVDQSDEEKPKPAVRVEPQSTVYTGDTVTLICELQTSLTGWTFYWLKTSQSEPLTADENTNTISVTVSNRGTEEYKCIARRGETDTHYSDPVKITVRETPKPAVRVEPQSTVYTGDTVTLICELQTSLTGWTFFWFKKSPSAQLTFDENTNTISVTVSNRGTEEYKCAARRGETDTDYSDQVKITVRERPKAEVKVQPAEQAFITERVTLTCDIEGGDVWSYEWFKNNNRLSEAERRKTYQISNVDQSDEGDYSCKGTKSTEPRYSETSAAVRVTGLAVRPKPKLTSSLKGAALTGNSVILDCRLDESAGWTSYWFKHTQNPQNEIKTKTHTYSYTIRSVSVSDEGQYWCRAARGNPAYYTQYSDALWVNVSGAAQAVLNVSLQSWLTEGDSVTLHCEVRDSSTGWTFSWYRDDEELLSDSRREAGGSFTLSPAALNHSGVYKCRAKRGEPAFHTQDSNTQPLWITGTSPPVSLIISPSRTQHFITDRLSLSCEGQSESTGWRVRRYTHSGKVSDCSSDRRSATGSTCNISSVSTSDTGVYWCQSDSGGRSSPLNVTVHKLISGAPQKKKKGREVTTTQRT